MTGTGRTANRMAAVAAGALAAVVLAGGGTAGAVAGTATGTATVEKHAGAGETGWKLPRNFLLHEARARKPVAYPEEEKWTVSDRHERLSLTPCGVGRSEDRGRVSTRTVTYTAPELYRAEQVVIYRSERAARAAMTDLRRRAGRCEADEGDQVVARGRTEKIRAGDQAVRVIVQNYDREGGGSAIGGQRGVVVRKGRALVSYMYAGEYGEVRASDFRRQLRDARKMAVKVCSLPGVC
ncbi:hypothetical protein Ppa06_20470 [Planomonospora parontospora subsp. parontospora]|uniref:Uncharacterized protein n=2 Tax=Planomonospora parontospora TaxID=58119 RepID=A0AA37BFJ2_9ACTN|nr:hypothetical protein [Planomonospora parontospora]GGK63093.1 hypothetical protein GCM10010126_23080 [Planomonospora parontospora]GII08249.1 hypothetical protein Ppa06_20470 [Planomonospora parontospora subsp. parontospora]